MALLMLLANPVIGQTTAVDTDRTVSPGSRIAGRMPRVVSSLGITEEDRFLEITTKAN